MRTDEATDMSARGQVAGADAEMADNAVRAGCGAPGGRPVGIGHPSGKADKPSKYGTGGARDKAGRART